MSTDIYPMPMFPTLAVANVAASTRWYEALGFQHVFTWPGPTGQPLLVHLRWAKYADLLILQDASPDMRERGHGITLTFTLQTDEVESLAERAASSGSRILAEPTVQPWNARDVSIADPDGYRLTFSFGPVDADATIDQLTERSR